MRNNRKRSSKLLSFAIGLLNVLKETCTFLFSIVIGILKLVQIAAE